MHTPPPIRCLYIAGSHPGHLSFCGQDMPDWTSNLQYITGFSRFLCRLSPRSFLAVFPSLSFLLAPCSITNAAQGQPAPYHLIPSLPPSLFPDSALSHSQSRLFTFLVLPDLVYQFAMCFLPPCSCPHAACIGSSLPFSCFATSLSLPVLLSGLLASRAPGIHAGILQSGRCVAACMCGRLCVCVCVCVCVCNIEDTASLQGQHL